MLTRQTSPKEPLPMMGPSTYLPPTVVPVSIFLVDIKVIQINTRIISLCYSLHKKHSQYSPLRMQHFPHTQTQHKKLKFESSFDTLIKQYQQVIQSLYERVNFLEEERKTLLQESAVLKERLRRFQTNQSIEICMDNLSKADDSLIFQEVSELTELNQESSDSLSPVRRIKEASIHLASSEMSMLLTQTKQSQNECEQALGIRTPMLHEAAFRNHYYRSSFSLKGLIRAFYIKVLTLPECVTTLIGIIQKEYQESNYQQIYLFSKYPDNMIIGDLMIGFLNQLSDMTHFHQLIRRITQFQLYDDILCQLILHKLPTYVQLTQPFNQHFACKCFYGLAEIFELIFIINPNGNFDFYHNLENKRRLHSDQSEYVSKVQEEISLNPGKSSQSKCFVENNYSQPLFTIEYNSQAHKFQFLIKEELSVSQCKSFTEQKPSMARDFNQSSGFYKPKLKGEDYLASVEEELFGQNNPQKSQSVSPSEQSRREFRAALQKYNRHRYGSRQSSMLLSSNNSMRYSKQLRQNNKQNRGYNQSYNKEGQSAQECYVVHQSIQEFHS